MLLDRPHFPPSPHPGLMEFTGRVSVTSDECAVVRAAWARTKPCRWWPNRIRSVRIKFTFEYGGYVARLQLFGRNGTSFPENNSRTKRTSPGVAETTFPADATKGGPRTGTTRTSPGQGVRSNVDADENELPVATVVSKAFENRKRASPCHSIEMENTIGIV